jgi:hypothetical protein
VHEPPVAFAEPDKVTVIVFVPDVGAIRYQSSLRTLEFVSLLIDVRLWLPYEMLETLTDADLIEIPTIIILFEPEPVVWLHEIEVEPFGPLFPELLLSKVMVVLSVHAL